MFLENSASAEYFWTVHQKFRLRRIFLKKGSYLYKCLIFPRVIHIILENCSRKYIFVVSREARKKSEVYNLAHGRK